MKLFKEIMMMKLLQSCNAAKLLKTIIISQKPKASNKHISANEDTIPEETLGKHDYEEDEEVELTNPYDFTKELEDKSPEIKNIDSYKKLTLATSALPNQLEKVLIRNSLLSIDQSADASKLYYRGEKDELLLHMIDFDTFTKSTGDRFSSIIGSVIDGANDFISDSLINVYSFNKDMTKMLLNTSVFNIKLETETRGTFVLAVIMPIAEWTENILDNLEEGEKYDYPKDCYTRSMIELVGKVREAFYEFQDNLEEYEDPSEEEMESEELTQKRIDVIICKKVKECISEESDFKDIKPTIAFGRL